MDQFAENYIAENSALRRKLHSKAEALLILSRELEQCRIERDQFRMMAEQVQDRYTKLKKMTADSDVDCSRLVCDLPLGKSFSQLMDEVKEKNKVLILEVEDLKQRLRDADGDIKALRSGLTSRRCTSDGTMGPSHQREELVEQLEQAGARCAQLQGDMQALLDEKEELVTQRDGYRCKVHRLNHQLRTLLNAGPAQLVDVDSILMENKYLHERMEQALEEKELSTQALIKYKSMLDKKRNKGSVRLGTNGSSAGMIISHKQVQQLLECGTASQLPNTEATLADLRSLCLALLEALQDKSLALSHQRKSNKILAGRVNELEARLSNAHENGGCAPVFPSQILLQNYTGSNVDKDLQNSVDSDGVDEIFDGLMQSTTSEHNSDLKSDSSASMKSSDDNSDNLNTCKISGGETDSDTDQLPPQLQELVRNALKDIESQSRSEQ